MAITHDKDLSDGYLWRRRLQWGEEKYHGTLPGHEIEEIRVLSQENHGSGGLVPQRLLYVKGLCKLAITVAVMS